MKLEAIRCSVCGADKISERNGIIECPYCGATYSKERYSFLDENIKSSYNRALEYRLELRFDDAIRVLDSLINKLPDCSELYYQALLARLGVSFVEENGKQKITVSRLINSSVFELKEAKLALKNAEPAFRKEYEETFSRIEEIRSRFIKIAKDANQYDVFICFKQHPDDRKTSYTQDYEVARNIYEDLTKKGIRVFFSAVSLEAGTDYEPYIYRALQTSKIMLVIAASPEEDYLNSPWVKNEWSRFDSLAHTEDKTLIPVLAYGFRPEYLPGLISNKQAIIYDASFWKNLTPTLKKYHLLKEKKAAAGMATGKRNALIAGICGAVVIALTVSIVVPIAVTNANKNKGNVTYVIGDNNKNTDPDYDGSISSITLYESPNSNGTGYAFSVGQTQKFSGYFRPTNATESYHFVSEDPTMMSFEGSTATGLKGGITKCYVVSDINGVKSNKANVHIWELQYEKEYEINNFNAYGDTIETCTISDVDMFFRSSYVGSTSNMSLSVSMKITKTYQDTSSSQKKLGMHLKIYDKNDTLVGQTSSSYMIKTDSFNAGDSVIYSKNIYLDNTKCFEGGVYRVEYIAIKWTDVY